MVVWSPVPGRRLGKGWVPRSSVRTSFRPPRTRVQPTRPTASPTSPTATTSPTDTSPEGSAVLQSHRPATGFDGSCGALVRVVTSGWAGRYVITDAGSAPPQVSSQAHPGSATVQKPAGSQGWPGRATAGAAGAGNRSVTAVG